MVVDEISVAINAVKHEYKFKGKNFIRKGKTYATSGQDTGRSKEKRE